MASETALNAAPASLCPRVKRRDTRSGESRFLSTNISVCASTMPAMISTSSEHVNEVADRSSVFP